MLYSVEEIVEKLKDFKIVNPKLENDGYGEFPDTYKLSELNLKEIEKLFKLVGSFK